MHSTSADAATHWYIEHILFSEYVKDPVRKYLTMFCPRKYAKQSECLQYYNCVHRKMQGGYSKCYNSMWSIACIHHAVIINTLSYMAKQRFSMPHSWKSFQGLWKSLSFAWCRRKSDSYRSATCGQKSLITDCMEFPKLIHHSETWPWRNSTKFIAVSPSFWVSRCIVPQNWLLMQQNENG